MRTAYRPRQSSATAWAAALVLLVALIGRPAAAQDEAASIGWPVAAFSAALPADAAEAATREARNDRYSLSRGGGFVAEMKGDQYISFDGHSKSLKDLVTEADSVLEGTIETAAAYLSTNRLVVYSEFRVRVTGVLKDAPLSRQQQPSSVGEVVTVLREGGGVELPSQLVVRQFWNEQGLPGIGGRYVLFSRREPPINALTVITGYEVKEAEVQPLDGGIWFPKPEAPDATAFRQQILSYVTN